MNKLMTQRQATDLAISTETRDLIQQGIAPNTDKGVSNGNAKVGSLAQQSDSDRWLAGNLHHRATSPG